MIKHYCTKEFLTSTLIFSAFLVPLITGITETEGIIGGTESVNIYMKPHKLVLMTYHFDNRN